MKLLLKLRLELLLKLRLELRLVLRLERALVAPQLGCAAASDRPAGFWGSF